jgi:predicted DNA-binding transcriptional regulator AlpA
MAPRESPLDKMAQVLNFPAPQERWIKKSELADHLAVSERTIGRWMAEGMPHRKGHSRKKTVRQDAVRFKLSECEAWLRE